MQAIQERNNKMGGSSLYRRWSMHFRLSMEDEIENVNRSTSINIHKSTSVDKVLEPKPVQITSLPRSQLIPIEKLQTSNDSLDGVVISSCTRSTLTEYTTTSTTSITAPTGTVPTNTRKTFQSQNRSLSQPYSTERRWEHTQHGITHQQPKNNTSQKGETEKEADYLTSFTNVGLRVEDLLWDSSHTNRRSILCHEIPNVKTTFESHMKDMLASLNEESVNKAKTPLKKRFSCRRATM